MSCCSFCSAEYEHNNIIFDDICLDRLSKSNPIKHLDCILQICPQCGMVTDNLTKHHDRKQYAEIIISKINACEEYQKILLDNNINTLEKKMLLAQIAGENNIDAGWYNSNMDVKWFVYHNSSGNTEKAIYHLDKKRESVELSIHNLQTFYNTDKITNDVLDSSSNDILVLADMYRQVANFNEAMEWLKLLEKYKFGNHKKVEKNAMKELVKLCKKQDSSRFQISGKQ